MLIGRLTKTPELRATQTGKQVCSFTIATNRVNGEEADFINCVVWDKQAENLCKYQVKGSLIGVIGQLRQETYNDTKGNKRTSYVVYCSEIEYLSSVSHKEDKTVAECGNPFKEMSTKVESDLGQQIEITSNDLPF
jgi:single-strand DNA-binding protein